MSQSSNYYRIPLSVLHKGQSALDALDIALSCGLVNAGKGFERTRSEEEFECVLAAACESDPDQNSRGVTEEVWRWAMVGSQILGVSGGDRKRNVRLWRDHGQDGGVFFTMRHDLMWNAIRTAREEEGDDQDQVFKRLSWREFRLLAGILSAPVSESHSFTFLGWESIQARACGFHNKELFNAGRHRLPAHCQPLTRSQIDLTIARLEANRFFLRFRYSKGDRGGKTAYSFRHETRELLAAAVQEFQKLHCIKPTISENRAKDRDLCK